MRPAWLHGIDILLGTVVLRAMLGWLSTNPRVLKLFIPIGVAGLLLMFNVYVQLPLVTMLVVFVVLPMTLLLLLSSIGEMHSFYERATVRAMFSLEAGGSQAFAPRLAPALQQLSRERIGALIVMPRNNDVHRLITGGETYDAKFTRSLLLSLFNPESPRHDGALVLEGERVTCVGAVLPLASAEGAREEWGTRHLAAVGLSENCDADVLVVSEERGTISHVRHGELHELAADSEETLTAELENALGHFGPAEKRSMHPPSKWMLLWVVALCVSIVVSFNVDRVADRFFSKPALITSREVPINLINIPEGLFVDKLSSGKCEMLVQLPKDRFLIGNIQWPVVIDLTGYEPGPVSIQLTRELIPKFPREWVIYRFTPERITFNLVKVRRQSVKIRPRFDGLRKNLEVVDSVATPAELKVEIRDPERSSKQRLETFPIDLSKIQAPGEYVVDAWLNLPATITLVEPNGDEKKLSVTVKIEER